MSNTVELYELPGTKGKNGRIKATQVWSGITAGGFLRALTIEKPVTTAGDYGSITVWFDARTKVWRGERHVRFGCVSEVEAGSKRGLRDWVDKTLKANQGKEAKP